ncbi:unnamed protein product, partial [Laminaria digitata]
MGREGSDSALLRIVKKVDVTARRVAVELAVVVMGCYVLPWLQWTLSPTFCFCVLRRCAVDVRGVGVFCVFFSGCACLLVCGCACPLVCVCMRASVMFSCGNPCRAVTTRRIVSRNRGNVRRRDEGRGEKKKETVSVFSRWSGRSAWYARRTSGSYKRRQ